jgi:hypothetical protein
VFARQLEQSLAVRFHMIAVEQSLSPLRHDRPEPEFALDQRQVTQVFSLVPEQVESVEPRFATPE